MKQVTSSWFLSLFNYQDGARSNKHKIHTALCTKVYDESESGFPLVHGRQEA